MCDVHKSLYRMGAKLAHGTGELTNMLHYDRLLIVGYPEEEYAKDGYYSLVLIDESRSRRRHMILTEFDRAQVDYDAGMDYLVECQNAIEDALREDAAICDITSIEYPTGKSNGG